MKINLPIDELLPACAEALVTSSSLILQASPGSGKTTRLPPYLLQSPWNKSNSQIWVLEPRRLAAKFAALRVAEEDESKVGDTVGYHFRFEKSYSDKTRLLYLTEGMLMRRIISNPMLEGVSAVILDEFHERHLHTDLSLSFLRRLQKTSRPDLKIIVMSATLEIENLKSFLSEAPVLQLSSPLFPVEIKYLESNESEKPLPQLVKEAIRKEFTLNGSGDCLVFLPGLREIRQCEAELEALSRQFSFQTLGLHGDFAKEEQERALKPQDKRKVILSTNLAETSVTIPGIKCVIDSGLQRVASYSWWTGIPRLSTRNTSKASAIQRAGRAGRTSPGTCYRLYSKHEFETKTAFDTPEIHRADLTQPILELKALGIKQISHFEWFESPALSSIESAQKLLYQLGALTSDKIESELTPIGIEMKNLSLHPRIARFLIECRENGCLDKGLTLAALISEGKLETLDATEQINRPLDFLTQKLRKQLEANFERSPKPKTSQITVESDRISFSLLTAFPDRVAEAKPSKKSAHTQSNSSFEFVLSAGKTATLNTRETFHFSPKEPYCIALDLQELKRGTHSTISLTSLVPIQQSWLFDLNPSPLEDSEIIGWDRERQRVFSNSQIKIGQIVIDSSERPIMNEMAVFELLVGEILHSHPTQLEKQSVMDWIGLFKNLFTQNEMENEIARADLFNKTLGLGLEVRGTHLSQFTQQWFAGKRSLKEITAEQCFDEFRSFFTENQSYLLEKKCPTQIVFPNQRKATVHYEMGKPPWVESKLQDFFGLTQPPQICDGKVALTVHLLAPNYRAVQVTSDLKGFWEKHYPTIRKELSRNYPRHPWPENPYIPLPPRPAKKN